MAAESRTFHSPAPRESLSDRIRPHLTTIAKKAAVTEAARMVSRESIQLIKDAGFVRALLPAALGGDERDIWDYCDAVRLISKACPSTGWVTGVLNIHPAAICHYDLSVQKEIQATGVDTILCSSGSPQMKATLTDGGIILSGRGRFSSGCDHAEWAMVGARVPDPTDSQYPERNYRGYLCMIPRSDYVIEDTWYSTGQRGSGSKDLIFKDVFIPFRRMESLDAIYLGYTHGAGTCDGWLSRVPFPLLFPTFMPAVALGCADGMIEEFTKRQRVRKNVITHAKGILNPAGYMRLAESVHEIDSLSVYFRHLLEAIQGIGERRERLTETMSVDLLSKLPFITTRAIQVIDRLFAAAGASAIADASPMQRYWRDAHATGLHVASDYDVSLQHHGRFILGLPPTPDL